MNKSTESMVIIPPIANTDAAKWSYVSLVFSVFYFFNVFANFARFSAIELVSVAAIYVGFLALFVGTTRNNGSRATTYIIGIIALVGVGTSVTPSTIALFGYAAFFSGYYFRSTKAFGLLALNVATQIIAAYAFGYWQVEFLAPSVLLSSTLFLFGFFSQKETRHQIEQQHKNQQIEQISAIAERERIARDMHDLLGHTLSSLALKSELSKKLIEKQQYAKASNEIDEVAALSRQCLSEVRQAIAGLKQTGIANTVDTLIKALEERGFQVLYQIEPKLSWSTLDAKIESAVIMICKELVTNIIKHSKADRVEWHISGSNNMLTISIKDNGGVDKIELGNGLSGIKNRVNELGGHIKISSLANGSDFLSAKTSETSHANAQGFEVSFQLPMKTQEEAS